MPIWLIAAVSKILMLCFAIALAWWGANRGVWSAVLAGLVILGVFVQAVRAGSPEDSNKHEHL